MYKIKNSPEDFIVREKSTIEIGDSGEYTYFVLKKINYNTFRAIQHIAKVLRKPVKYFGFAGNKDKAAITEQICSIKNISKENLERINLKDIEISYIGKGARPISLGLLEGNYFEVIIRDIDFVPEIRTEFINFFGEQRFGTNNANIGKAIVNKDFKEAIKLILDIDDLPEMKEHLRSSSSDFLGALRTIPLRILKLYVHGYQSKLWNDLAKISTDREIPLIGFGTEVSEKIKKILKKENIKTRDFIIRELPELSSEGDIRKRFVNVKNLEIGKLKDNSVKLKFFLPKGSYATEFIKQSFG